MALDVTGACDGDLAAFLRRLNAASERAFERSVALALPPFQQAVGRDVFEMAFVRDADGALVELLRRAATLDVEPAPDW